MHEGVDAEELRRRLERSVAHLCPRWLRQERDDLVQTSIVRILERVRGGVVRDVNATYLWKTAYTVVLDELRRARFRHERPLEDALAESKSAPEHAGPERRVLQEEFVRAVQACLRELARDRRQAVQLRLAGLRHAEAARLLGSDVKRIANLMFRGFDDLRSCLREKGVAGP